MSEHFNTFALFVVVGVGLLATMPRVAAWYFSPGQIERRRRAAADEAEREQEREQHRALAEEKAQRRWEAAERNAACAAVFDFYDRHRRYLRCNLPEEVLDARLMSGIHDDTSVAEAWDIAGDLLIEMNAIVLEGRTTERHERSVNRRHEKRLSKIDHDIEKYETRLTTLESSPMRAEVAEEILEIHRRLEELENDRLDAEEECPLDREHP